MKKTCRLLDFFLLNKPIVVLLLLTATYTGMVVSIRSLPEFWITFWTLLGGGLCAGGAGAINQVIDRDLDRAMPRTQNRPIPGGRLSPSAGLIYGLAACLAGLGLLVIFVNLLAALLSLLGILYYTLLYSLILKRKTVHNIVIGSGAGALPGLVGWAAASGALDGKAFFLFAIVFLWSPPHFWSLALTRQAEFAAAGIPVLPVVCGEKVTHWAILIYGVILGLLTALMPVFNLGSPIFSLGSLVLGILLIGLAVLLLVKGKARYALNLYQYSNIYLALLFILLITDVLMNR